MICRVRQSRSLAENVGSLKMNEVRLEIARSFRNVRRFKLRKKGRFQ